MAQLHSAVFLPCAGMQSHAAITFGRNLHRMAIRGREDRMSCRSCQSGHQSNLNGEIAIHFPGLSGLDKPIVWVFPKLLVCLDCGNAEFSVPESELRVLAKGDAAAGE